MLLVRGLHNVAQRDLGCVLTVGNYDGVHLGHQQMIGVLRSRAAQLRTLATVLVFEPSFKEFVDPQGAPPRLTRWREKFLALADCGVDCLVTLRFDEKMQAMTPQTFVEDLIVRGVRARHVVVGDDFRYGRNAEGDVESLRQASLRWGFGVEQMAPYVFDGVRVSSTEVRARLLRGDFTGAARLLGRPYRMSGRIAPAEQLRRTAGFRSGAIPLMRRRSPVHGVSAVRIFGIEPRPMPAVASLEQRRTPRGEQLLGVHVLDFEGDLSGRAVEIEFVAWLHPTVNFDSTEKMTMQMKQDAATVRQLLSAG